jgi:hypothetical protein
MTQILFPVHLLWTKPRACILDPAAFRPLRSRSDGWCNCTISVIASMGCNLLCSSNLRFMNVWISKGLNPVPSDLRPLRYLLLCTLYVQGCRITQIREVFLKRKLLTPTWNSPTRCTTCRAYRVFRNPVSVFSSTLLFSQNSK